jgi:hypothetical protein
VVDEIEYYVEHFGARNVPFQDLTAIIGINDAAVGFHMALPGTQMFESLYDSGRSGSIVATSGTSCRPPRCGPPRRTRA